jgi:hypothetical protein
MQLSPEQHQQAQDLLDTQGNCYISYTFGKFQVTAKSPRNSRWVLIGGMRFKNIEAGLRELFDPSKGGKVLAKRVDK